MMFRVVFTGYSNGFDCSAYFNNPVDCDEFAKLMAEAGRLTKVTAGGLDITEKYVTIVRI